MNLKNAFLDFLKRRNPTSNFPQRYVGYMNSRIIYNAAMKYAATEDIFSISNPKIVKKIYLEVKSDANNIRLHNIYSGVVSAYLKFLEGKDLRKRVSICDNASFVNFNEVK